VVVADLDGDGAAAVAAGIGAQALAVRTDVSRESRGAALVAHGHAQFGQVDIFCSNAGIISRATPMRAPPPGSATGTSNVMAHVHAANAVLPQMLARGEGWLAADRVGRRAAEPGERAPYS